MSVTKVKTLKALKSKLKKNCRLKYQKSYPVMKTLPDSRFLTMPKALRLTIMPVNRQLCMPKRC